MKWYIITFLIGVIAGCLICRGIFCTPEPDPGEPLRPEIRDSGIVVDPDPVETGETISQIEALERLAKLDRDNKRITFMLSKVQSMLDSTTVDADSVVAAALDSAWLVWCDSVSKPRTYQRTWGDSGSVLITDTDYITGFKDSGKVTWWVPEVPMPLPARYLSLDLAAPIDTSGLDLGIGGAYTDRKGRSFRINKSLFRPGGEIGASIPIRLKFLRK